MPSLYFWYISTVKTFEFRSVGTGEFSFRRSGIMFSSLRAPISTNFYELIDFNVSEGANCNENPIEHSHFMLDPAL